MYCCENRQRVTRENMNDTLPLDTYPTILHMAVRYGCSNCVDWLIEEQKAKLNVCDALGDTPLHDAVIMFDVGVVKSLLAKKASVNITNNRNQTPLGLLLRCCHVSQDFRGICIETANALLSGGASVNTERHPIPEWFINVKTKFQARENCRRVCVVFIGIRRKRHTILDTNVRDITAMVTRMIWATRLKEKWVI